MAPNTGKRWEKGIEGGGGDELEARQNTDSSTHRELEEDTVLTAGTASRRGTRLSSIPIPSGTLSPSLDLAKRQIAHAALQSCRPFKQPDRTTLLGQLRGTRSGEARRAVPPAPGVPRNAQHPPIRCDQRQRRRAVCGPETARGNSDRGMLPKQDGHQGTGPSQGTDHGAKR